MSALAKCDAVVYERGTPVFATHSIDPVDMENWVKEVAKRSGQNVDWHYAEKLFVVKALGNLEEVSKAIDTVLLKHNELQAKSGIEEPFFVRLF